MFKLQAAFICDGHKHATTEFDNPYFTVDYSDAFNHITAKLLVKKDITFESFSLDEKHAFDKNDIFFANGYQSWSTSVERTKDETAEGYIKLADYISLGQYCASTFADYNFTNYWEKGVFHSATFTYLRKKGGKDITLYGSKSERQGFTFFEVDMQKGRFSITKDVEGLQLKAGQEYDLVDVTVINDSYDNAFDQYFFKFCGFKKPKIDRLAGYTSWYNYFRNIDEKIILRDLDGLDIVKDQAEIFQIDDGYSKVGDWTSPDKEKFPNGLKAIVEKVHAKGYKAGLWLAPLNVQMSSDLFKAHRDWLIPSPKYGPKLPELGLINWGPTFVLDIEKPEVRGHLKNVFNTVLNEWGFDMVKLDFLYTACMFPRNGKTRGQLMCEAVDLLRECCGDKIVLGCGCPLGACMGIFDACRIGCDVNPVFAGDLFNKLKLNNELPCTRNTMMDTVFRRGLNGRAFLNDPDVFFLRDFNLDFTMEQKLDLAKVNDMCGSIIFMSDDAGQYDDKAKKYLKNVFSKKDYKVELAEFVDADTLKIKYTENGKKKTLQFNLNDGKGNVTENF